MTELIHAMSVGTFVPTLRSLSGVLAKAQAHFEASGVDLRAIATARLAPDMFTFAQQIDVASVQVKFATAVLTGHDVPPFQPVDPTFAAFQQRIEETIAFAEAAPEAAFAGVADRPFRVPLPDAGITLEMTGLELLRDWALPHFYFHVVTAYDILRSHGAPLGKLDYLAHVGYAIRRDSPAVAR